MSNCITIKNKRRAIVAQVKVWNDLFSDVEITAKGSHDFSVCDELCVKITCPNKHVGYLHAVFKNTHLAKDFIEVRTDAENCALCQEESD